MVRTTFIRHLCGNPFSHILIQVTSFPENQMLAQFVQSVCSSSVSGAKYRDRRTRSSLRPQEICGWSNLPAELLQTRLCKLYQEQLLLFLRQRWILMDSGFSTVSFILHIVNWWKINYDHFLCFHNRLQHFAQLCMCWRKKKKRVV